MVYTIFNLMEEGYNSSYIIALVLGFTLALIFAFTFHEYAHAFTAYKFGDTTAKSMGRLTLNPLAHIDTMGIICFVVAGFGWAKPVPINPTKFTKYKKGCVWVSLSGVLVNLASAFVFSAFLILYGAFVDFSTNMFLTMIYFLLYYLVTLNVALFVFNLLPIYPLDGFNFLSCFLRPDNKFLKFMRNYGGIILFLFILSPLFDIIYSALMNGIMRLFSIIWGLII